MAAAAKPPVLIVESDALAGASLAQTLAGHCAPIVAPNFEQAMHLMPSQAWSGFLVEVGLPDRSGLDLLPIIRRARPLVPIVVMTGNAQRGASAEALRHRAFYVEKPIPDSWQTTFCEWLGQGIQVGLRQRLATLGLSNAQQEVLVRVARGATAKAVGRELGISAGTVQSHCAHAYELVGAKSFTGLLAKAFGWQ